jgi:predicted dehydrogenase
MSVTRRGFFGATAAVSTALTAGTAAAQDGKPQGRRALSGSRLLRIGVLTCHPAYHHMQNIWGPLITCTPLGGFTPTRMTGLELTHIWAFDPKRVESYCQQFGTRPVSRYDGMVKLVDGVMLTDVRYMDDFPRLAEPYLKAGVPVLFNRPFVSHQGNAKKIVEMSRKYGTPFIAVSSWEYCREVSGMHRKVREWGADTIRAVSAYNSSTEINHDLHGVWLILAMIGGGVESVSVTRNIKSIHETGADAWTIEFKPRGKNPAFYATLHNTIDRETNAWVKVIFDKGEFEQSLWHTAGGDNEERYQNYFIPPLLEFQRMIERGTMPQTHEEVLEKTAVFLAGFKSLLKLEGKPALLSELEDDFTVQSDQNPLKLPEGFFG